MSKSGKKITVKKEIAEQVSLQLVSSLTGLKELLGEKKFLNRVKKATKLLVAGVKTKATGEKKGKVKKAKEPGGPAGMAG